MPAMALMNIHPGAAGCLYHQGEKETLSGLKVAIMVIYPQAGCALNIFLW